MAGTPILTNAENNMQTLIEGMTTTGGFNFDWGTVNQKDLAKCTFPCAITELDPEITNIDEPTGIHANAYLQQAGFKIRVVGKLPSEVTNNIYAINEILLKELDDLLKLFGVGAGASLSGVVDIIQFRRATRPLVLAGDVFIPKELHTWWIVRYTQDRTDPTIPDP